jgi:predicted porin
MPVVVQTASWLSICACGATACDAVERNGSFCETLTRSAHYRGIRSAMERIGSAPALPFDMTDEPHSLAESLHERAIHVSPIRMTRRTRMTMSQFKSRSTGRKMALAILAAFVSTAGANAADLGGNCCADLEERIAELEATTARKGNRKVSLTVSGYVAQEITYWNDGGEKNIYLHGLGPTQATHVKFNGQAQIMPGVTAGYMLRIQNLDDNPFGRAGAAAMNQDNDNFSQGLNVQMSYWYLQSKDLGKLSVGRGPMAAKSAAMFTDQSGSQLISNYTFFSGFPNFVIRSGGNLVPATLTWGQLAFCYHQSVPIGGDCNGVVMNGVRYDTPVFAGFSASASWGEDDVWDVAARYAGEMGGFKLAFGVGYSQASDENTAVVNANIIQKDSNVFQVGGYIQHLATGLFVHAAYGREDNSGTRIAVGTGTPLDSDHWYVKAGLRQKWTALGATVLFADYAEYNDQLGTDAIALGATSGTLERYGFGISQEIDAAAMSIYLKYQHADAEITGIPAAIGGLDNLGLISVGGIFNF